MIEIAARWYLAIGVRASLGVTLGFLAHSLVALDHVDLGLQIYGQSGALTPDGYAFGSWRFNPRVDDLERCVSLLGAESVSRALATGAMADCHDLLDQIEALDAATATRR